MGKEQILIDGQLFDAETGELINEVEQVEVEIIENNLLDMQSIENEYGNYNYRPEITFKAKLLVCKEK